MSTQKYLIIWTLQLSFHGEFLLIGISGLINDSAYVCKYWNTHVFALLERIDFIGLDCCKLWRTIANGLNYDQIRHAKISEDFPDEIVM